MAPLRRLGCGRWGCRSARSGVGRLGVLLSRRWGMSFGGYRSGRSVVSVGRKLIYQLAPHQLAPALTLFKRTGVAFSLPKSSHQRSLEGKNHTFDKGKIKIIHPSALAGNPMHHTPQHSRFPLCKRLWIRTNPCPKPFALVDRVSVVSVVWLRAWGDSGGALGRWLGQSSRLNAHPNAHAPQHLHAFPYAKGRGSDKSSPKAFRSGQS